MKWHSYRNTKMKCFVQWGREDGVEWEGEEDGKALNTADTEFITSRCSWLNMDGEQAHWLLSTPTQLLSTPTCPLWALKLILDETLYAVHCMLTCMEHSTTVTATTASCRVTSSRYISLAWAAKVDVALQLRLATSVPGSAVTLQLWSSLQRRWLKATYTIRIKLCEWDF